MSKILNYLSKIYKAGLEEASKHAPEILAGLGISGFVGTAVLSAKAAPKVKQLKENKKAELNTNKLTLKEKLICDRPYLPAIVTGVSSTICVIGSVSTSLKRNAALTAAYTIVSDAARDYRNEVVKIIGEEKDKEIRDEIAKKDGQVIEGKNVLFVCDPMSKQLFYDPLTETVFPSTKYEIEHAIMEINHRLAEEGEVSYMELCLELGYQPGKLAGVSGWRMPADASEAFLLEVEFKPIEVNNNDRTAFAMLISPEPDGKYMYD